MIESYRRATETIEPSDVAGVGFPGSEGGKPDYAANLAFWLLDQTGTVYGVWSGRMAAAAQRSLFGRFLGKGRIVIDGRQETICNQVKVCFGMDSDDRNQMAWRDL
jgi:hypothetical protein